jgi:hypothetical protein
VSDPLFLLTHLPLRKPHHRQAVAIAILSANPLLCRQTQVFRLLFGRDAAVNHRLTSPSRGHHSPVTSFHRVYRPR